MNIVQAKSYKVLLLGDYCEDEVAILQPGKNNPENSSLLYNIVTRNTTLGMAGNVFNCLSSLGITDVTFVKSKSPVIKKLRYYINPFIPFCRIDSDVAQNRVILDNLDFSQFDCVVISDYNKGSTSDETILTVLEHSKGPVFLDTKKTDLKKFDGCIIKINESEYNNAISLPSKQVIVTLGSRGCRYNDSEYTTIQVDEVDVCGAGDAFLAGLVYGWLNTNNLESSIPYGLFNATISVTKPGCYAPSVLELTNTIQKFL